MLKSELYFGAIGYAANRVNLASEEQEHREGLAPLRCFFLAGLDDTTVPLKYFLFRFF